MPTFDPPYPRNPLIYNDFVTFCTIPFLQFPFLSFSFLFLSSPTAKMAEAILTHNSSYDAVSRKEVPFGVSMTKNNVWGQNPQKRKFLGRQWAMPYLQDFQMAISLKVVTRLT